MSSAFSFRDNPTLVHGHQNADLVLFKVTQSLDDDAAAALVLWVSGFQPHDAFRLVDQVLYLPFVVHDLLFFPLK